MTSNLERKQRIHPRNLPKITVNPYEYPIDGFVEHVPITGMFNAIINAVDGIMDDPYTDVGGLGAAIFEVTKAIAKKFQPALIDLFQTLVTNPYKPMKMVFTVAPKKLQVTFNSPLPFREFVETYAPIIKNESILNKLFEMKDREIIEMLAATRNGLETSDFILAGIISAGREIGLVTLDNQIFTATEAINYQKRLAHAV